MHTRHRHCSGIQNCHLETCLAPYHRSIWWCFTVMPTATFTSWMGFIRHQVPSLISQSLITWLLFMRKWRPDKQRLVQYWITSIAALAVHTSSCRALKQCILPCYHSFYVQKARCYMKNLQQSLTLGLLLVKGHIQWLRMRSLLLFYFCFFVFKCIYYGYSLIDYCNNRWLDDVFTKHLIRERQ